MANCSITPELQKNLLKYIALYLENNNTTPENVVSDIMKKLYSDVIGKAGKEENFYYINTISTIPFLIRNNILTSSLTGNELFDKYNDRFDIKNVNEITEELSSDDWFSYVNKLLGNNDKRVVSLSERDVEIRKLNAIGGFYTPLVEADLGGISKCDAIYIDEEGNIFKGTYTNSNGNSPAINGLPVEPHVAYNYELDLKEFGIENVLSSDVQIFNVDYKDPSSPLKFPKGICKVKFELRDGNSISDIFAEPKTSFNEKHNNYKFYLALYDGQGDKIGVIKHNSDYTEATDFEKKVITAYIASDENLFLEVGEEGTQFHFLSPKIVFDKKRPVKFIDTTNRSKKTKKQNIPFDIFISLPAFVRKTFDKDGQMNTNQIVKNEAENTKFSSIVTEQLQTSNKVIIDGQEIYLKAMTEAMPNSPITTKSKGPGSEIKTAKYRNPVGLVACDSSGNILKFSISDGELHIDTNGKHVMFDMFPFITQGWDLNDSNKTDALKKELSTVVDDETAEKIASNFSTYIQYLYTMRDAVNNGETMLFEIKQIIEETNTQAFDKEPISQDADFEFRNGFLYVDGNKTLLSDYDSSFADKLANLFKNQSMDFGLRKELFNGLFTNIIKVGNTRYDVIEMDDNSIAIMDSKSKKPVVTYIEGGIVINNKKKFDHIISNLKNKDAFGNVVRLMPNIHKNVTIRDFDGNPIDIVQLPVYTAVIDKVTDPIILFQPFNGTLAQTYAEESNNTIEQPKDTVPEEITENPTTNVDNDEKTDEDIINEFNDVDSEKLFKTLTQKNMSDPATEEQIAQAKQWYENNPLSKEVPFEPLFNAVNSYSIAHWSKNGITLLHGSDYTDVYHEAWHAFSQMFLTKEQKIRIYKDIKSKKGTFTDFDGNKISFKKADYKQTEEYLAEAFQKYMLTGKANETRPIIKLFRMIADIVRKLFGKNPVYTVEELFEKIKLGDISEFKKSDTNILFDKLNKSIKTKSGVYLSASDTLKIDKLVDIYIANYLPIDEMLHGKSFSYFDRVESYYNAYAESLSKGVKLTRADEDKIMTEIAQKYVKEGTTLDEQKDITRKAVKFIISTHNEVPEYNISNITSFLSNRERLRSAYKYARMMLLRKKVELLSKSLDVSQNGKLILKYNSQLATIENALNNFGDTKLLDKDKSGVIAQHFEKNFKRVDFIDSTEPDVDSDDELDPVKNNFSDNKVNAESAEERMGDNPVLKFILSTIPSYRLERVSEHTKKSEAEKLGDEYHYVADKNEFNEQNIKDFKHIKNRLVTLCEGSANVMVMYDRLQRAAYELTIDSDGNEGIKYINNKPVIKNPILHEILKRLGEPEDLNGLSTIDAINKTSLWNQMWQTFACPAVPLHESDIHKKTIFNKETRRRETNISVNIIEQSGPLYKLDDYYRTQFTEVAYTHATTVGVAMDFEKVLETFPSPSSLSTAQKKKYFVDLLRALGIAITPENACVMEIQNIINYGNINWYDKLLGDKGVLQLNKNNTFTDPVKFWQKNAYNFYKAVKQIDIKYTDGINAEQVRNAEGNTLYINQKNNSITVLFDNINECETYQDVLDSPELKHLDIRKYIHTDETHNNLPVYEINDRFNPVCAGSKFLLRLFNFNKSTIKKAYLKDKDGKYRLISDFEIINPVQSSRLSNNNIKLINLSGVKVDVNGIKTGISLFKSDPKTKLVADVIYMSNGEQEVMRHADNGVSYSVNFVNARGEISPYTTSVNISEHNGAYDMPFDLASSIRNGIVHEMERILVVRDLKKRADTDGFMYDRKYLNGEQVEFLGVYDDMLSPETKKEIFTQLDKMSNGDVVSLSNKTILHINKDLNKYYNYQIEDNLTDITDAFSILMSGESDSTMKKTIQSVYEKFATQYNLKEEDDLNVMLQNIAVIYTSNNLFYNIECLKLIYGDVFVFNLAKDEFTKRIKGLGSSGAIPCDDTFMRDCIAKMSQTSYYRKKTGKDPLINSEHQGQIKTAVCSDLFPVSAYAKAYAEISKDYETVGEESNAQGLISFDGYRYMCMRLNKWDESKEIMFQKLCNGEKIEPREWVKFFPVLKLQFFGPVDTGYMPEYAFHKYSLMPIIPTMAKGKNIDIVHEKMLKEGVTYITFNSGSKMFNVSSKNDNNIGVYKNQYGDKLYKPESLTIKGRIDNGQFNSRSLSDGLQSDEDFFTPNYIPLRYIKDQVLIHDELDPSTVFSTQMRRIVNNNLYEGGYPIDITTEQQRADFDNAEYNDKLKMSNAFALAEKYRKFVGLITENTKKNIMKQFGIQGEKFDEKKFIDYVKKELRKKDIPESVIDNINSFQQLEFSPFKDEVEKIILSLINKKVIRQHVHGGQYVQVASTLFEDTNGTSIGTNDLSFYGFSDIQEYSKENIQVAKDGETEPATIKIPLAGDFVNLLQAKDSNGNIIGNLENLNKCLKDNEWVNKNIDALTIISCRIPVQGYNSIEHFRIAEFLEPGCNNIIVCPSELVIKSGGDYDIDKLATVTPHIKVIKEECYVSQFDESKEESDDNIKELRNQVNKAFGLLFKNSYTKVCNIIKKDNSDSNKVAVAQKYKVKFESLAQRRHDIIEKINSVRDNYDVDNVDDTNMTKLYIDLSVVFDEMKSLMNDFYKDFDVVDAEWKAKSEGVSFKQIDVERKNYEALQEEYDNLFDIKYIKKKFNKSKAGLENSLIKSMASILKSNYVTKSMLTPNSTDYFVGENKPATVLSSHAKYDRFKNRMNPNYKKGENSLMSPTRLIESRYNRDKQSNFYTGKTILSKVAIGNVAVPVFKSSGLKLSKYSGYLKQDDNISESDVKKIKSNRFYKAHVLKNLNEELENAKDEVQINSINETIRKVISFNEQKILMKHNTAKVGQDIVIDLSQKYDALKDKEISDVLSQLVNGCVDVAKDAWITYIEGNDEAVSTLLFLVEAGVPVNDICYFMSSPAVVNYINLKIENNSALKKLTFLPLGAELNARAKALGIEITRNSSYNEICSLIQQKMYGSMWNGENFTSESIEDIALNKNAEDEASMQLLYHFFEIEDMSKPVNSLILSIRVDGTKNNSLYDVMQRQKGLDNLLKNPSLNQPSVQKIKDESILSSFYIGDMVTDIAKKTLPQKSDEKLLHTFQNIWEELKYFGYEAEDVFSAMFSDFNSFLYQRNKKLADASVELSYDAETQRIIQNIADYAGQNDYLVENTVNEIKKLNKLKEQIEDSNVFKDWKENFVGDDENLIDEFITIDAAQRIGNETALFQNSKLNIGTKFMLVKRLVSKDRKLYAYLSNKLFFNKIISEPFNNITRLLFESDMTTEERGVTYEEFQNLDLESNFSEGLTEYDKKFIVDFFSDLPYFCLIQSGLQPSRDSLMNMFDLSIEIDALWNDFKSDEDALQILGEFETMFVDKYSGNEVIDTNSFYIQSISQENEAVEYVNSNIDPICNVSDYAVNINNSQC